MTDTNNESSICCQLISLKPQQANFAIRFLASFKYQIYGPTIITGETISFEPLWFIDQKFTWPIDHRAQPTAPRDYDVPAHSG